MILAVDVQYRDGCGFTAGVTFDDWHAAKETQRYFAKTPGVGEYVPGEFYKRELPCILSIIDKIDAQVSCILIDGFVFLDGQHRPGLGKYLYDALHEKIAVIGVAKTSFDGIDDSYRVFRGDSQRPLYVTSAGIDINTAKAAVSSMYGAYRIPFLLKEVDRLCREAASKSGEETPGQLDSFVSPSAQSEINLS